MFLHGFPRPKASSNPECLLGPGVGTCLHAKLEQLGIPDADMAHNKLLGFALKTCSAREPRLLQACTLRWEKRRGSFVVWSSYDVFARAEQSHSLAFSIWGPWSSRIQMSEVPHVDEARVPWEKSFRTGVSMATVMAHHFEFFFLHPALHLDVPLSNWWPTMVKL